MNGRERFFTFSVLSSMLMLLLATTAIQGQIHQHQNIDQDKLQEAREESKVASEVSLNVMTAPDKAIPSDLSGKAEASAQGAGSMPAPRLMRVAHREPPAQESDRFVANLTREVRHELLMLPYYSVFDWIEFQVRPDGTVILSGYVTSPPDTKSRAEARVKEIEGVERVINNIEVLPVSPNDDRLRRRLYRAIYSGPLFRYAVGSLNTIHIIVKNGRATLYGVVDSEADKTLAYTRARSVPGLFAVENRLVVRGRDSR